MFEGGFVDDGDFVALKFLGGIMCLVDLIVNWLLSIFHPQFRAGETEDESAAKDLLRGSSYV